MEATTTDQTGLTFNFGEEFESMERGSNQMLLPSVGYSISAPKREI
jgi:hypothetical protein